MPSCAIGSLMVSRLAPSKTEFKSSGLKGPWMMSERSGDKDMVDVSVAVRREVNALAGEWENGEPRYRRSKAL